MAKRKDVTKAQVLQTAALLMQTRGSNGFSTRLLADELGISSASLHHHFPTKEDLISGVIAMTRERINEELSHVATEYESYEARMRQVAESLNDLAALIAMIAAEFLTLGNKAQDEARQLYTNLRGWFTRFAQQGKADGEILTEMPADQVAAHALSALIGMALLTRTEAITPMPLSTSAWAWQRV